MEEGTDWGNLPAVDGEPGTIAEAVSAMKHDMIHNRFEFVQFRLNRIIESGNLMRLRFYAPEF